MSVWLILLKYYIFISKPVSHFEFLKSMKIAHVQNEYVDHISGFYFLTIIFLSLLIYVSGHNWENRKTGRIKYQLDTICYRKVCQDLSSIPSIPKSVHRQKKHHSKTNILFPLSNLKKKWFPWTQLHPRSK